MSVRDRSPTLQYNESGTARASGVGGELWTKVVDRGPLYLRFPWQAQRRQTSLDALFIVFALGINRGGQQ